MCMTGLSTPAGSRTCHAEGAAHQAGDAGQHQRLNILRAAAHAHHQRRHAYQPIIRTQHAWRTA